MSVTPRIIAILLLLATGVLLGAYGTSHSAAAIGGSGSRRVASPHAHRLPSGYRDVAAFADAAHLTKTQAKAFARAVNLTSSDLPGFKVASEHGSERESVAEKRLEHEMLSCVHVASNQKLFAASSKEFQHESSAGLASTQSEVSVARSSNVAARELAVVRGGRTRTCLSHYLDLLLKGKFRGATFGPVSVVQGAPPPAPGTTGSFAWRIALALTVRGVRLPLYMDILGFVYGPAEVTLFTSGTPVPFPAAGERRLFSLLVGRARARSV